MISLNIRGLGDRKKRSVVRELVVKEKLDFICLQETKVSSGDDRLVAMLWGNKEVQWVFSGSDGASGGLCCLWDREVFKRENFGEKKDC